MPISPLPEHKIEVFVRFCPPEPSFSGISSTKSRFLCFFGLRDPCFLAFRVQNHHFCARLLNWMSGLGHFPADRGIVAPAQPILPLTLPPLHLLATAPAEPLHLRSRCTCATAVPAAFARRCTCAADTTAAYHRRTCRQVRVRVSFRLGRRS